MTMTKTPNQITRTIALFTEIAKEPLTVEHDEDTFYVFGSELAILRLFYEYNRNCRVEKTKIGYSEGAKSHYFRLITSLN